MSCSLNLVHFLNIWHFNINNPRVENTRCVLEPWSVGNQFFLIINMEEIDKKMFKEVVENIFVRWTALKLAVEHGMGGKSGQQVSKNFGFQPNQTKS